MQRPLTISLSILTLLYCCPIQGFSRLYYHWYGVANGPKFHWPGILKYSPQQEEVGRGLRGLKPVPLGSASSGKTHVTFGIMVGFSPAAWHVPISPSKADNGPSTCLLGIRRRTVPWTSQQEAAMLRDASKLCSVLATTGQPWHSAAQISAD